jgi:hypothetical protein
MNTEPSTAKIKRKKGCRAFPEAWEGQDVFRAS